MVGDFAQGACWARATRIQPGTGFIGYASTAALYCSRCFPDRPAGRDRTHRLCLPQESAPGTGQLQQANVCPVVQYRKRCDRSRRQRVSVASAVNRQTRDLRVQAPDSFLLYLSHARAKCRVPDRRYDRVVLGRGLWIDLQRRQTRHGRMSVIWLPISMQNTWRHWKRVSADNRTCRPESASG